MRNLTYDGYDCGYCGTYSGTFSKWIFIHDLLLLVQYLLIL